MPGKKTFQMTTKARVNLTEAARRLKKETVRRQAAEKALQKSKERADQLVEQSRLLRKHVRLISRQTLLIQEEERKKISRELHDVIAQILAGINIQLAALKIEVAANTKGLGRKISCTQKLVEKSVDIVHRFAQELRPAVLDDLGLIPALHSFMKRFSEESGVRVSLTAFAGVEKLSGVKRTALYRVAQEALTNIARHAHASRAEVILTKLPSAVQLRIKDNGQSFDVKKALNTIKSKRMGLIGMRERIEIVGGRFMIESTPGTGTTIDVTIPFRKSIEEKSAE